MKRSLFFSFACLLLIISGLEGCVVVDEGYVGVKKKFGKISEKELKPGVHLYLPVANEVELWDVKTQTRKMQLDLPSNEGLIVKFETTLLFKPKNVIDIRRNIGSEYIPRVVDPELKSVFRDIIGKQGVAELITNSDTLAGSATAALKESLSSRGILVEELKVTKLELPLKFKEAIESKIQEEEKVKQMGFALESAKISADIEIARAEGAAKAQEIVKKTLSPAYLQYLWISTLNENPNVIYVSTEANMPVFRTVGEPKAKPAPLK